jgi:DNA-binding NarL/FixJ family response regulator
MTIGVVVADDQAIVRAGFRMLIDSEPDLAVLGEAANGEIAERLIMSVPTAKTHVSRILAKLGARDRAQLVVLAFQYGLVRPG